MAAAPYAGLVEFGTSKRISQPFMKPAAAEVSGGQIRKILANELEDAL